VELPGENSKGVNPLVKTTNRARRELKGKGKADYQFDVGEIEREASREHPQEMERGSKRW